MVRGSRSLTAVSQQAVDSTHCLPLEQACLSHNSKIVVVPHSHSQSR